MTRYVKLRKMNGAVMITIPSDIFAKSGFQIGDRMAVTLLNPTTVTITKGEEDGQLQQPKEQ